LTLPWVRAAMTSVAWGVGVALGLDPVAARMLPAPFWVISVVQGGSRAYEVGECVWI
jgi:hypothetical protein